MRLNRLRLYMHADFHRKVLALDSNRNSRADNSGFAANRRARQLRVKPNDCRKWKVSAGRVAIPDHMHARSDRKSRSSHARDRIALRVLEFVNDAHGSFRTDLVGVEETAGDAINRDAQGDMTMMGVQIHAHARQASQRTLAAKRRLRRDPHS